MRGLRGDVPVKRGYAVPDFFGGLSDIFSRYFLGFFDSEMPLDLFGFLYGVFDFGEFFGNYPGCGEGNLFADFSDIFSGFAGCSFGGSADFFERFGGELFNKSVNYCAGSGSVPLDNFVHFFDGFEGCSLFDFADNYGVAAGRSFPVLADYSGRYGADFIREFAAYSCEFGAGARNDFVNYFVGSGDDSLGEISDFSGRTDDLFGGVIPDENCLIDGLNSGDELAEFGGETYFGVLPNLFNSDLNCGIIFPGANAKLSSGDLFSGFGGELNCGDFNSDFKGNLFNSDLISELNSGELISKLSTGINYAGLQSVLNPEINYADLISDFGGGSDRADLFGEFGDEILEFSDMPRGSSRKIRRVSGGSGRGADEDLIANDSADFSREINYDLVIDRLAWSFKSALESGAEGVHI